MPVAQKSGRRVRHEEGELPFSEETTAKQARAIASIASMPSSGSTHAEPCSIHAVVTDPPYGLVEYTARELEKMQNGRGGVWRIPPSFDGCKRSPLPRFTVLTEKNLADLRAFFARLAEHLMPVLVPGGHVFIATNPLVSYLVYEPFIQAGFREARRDHPCGSHPARRRPSQERPRRVRRRHGHAQVLLGALGPVPQAMRGPRAGQPAPVEDGGPPPPIGPRTFQGPDLLFTRLAAWSGGLPRTPR